ncbi:MAG TPA: hypothetical protein VN947_34110 [Polyangia bacterium]|nr:hypothetical protein [Polyangia bacterium]
METEQLSDLEILGVEFVAETAPTRVRIEARRTPDGVTRWWSECDADALDAIVGESPEEATARVLARITKLRGASA